MVFGVFREIDEVNKYKARYQKFDEIRTIKEFVRIIRYIRN